MEMVEGGRWCEADLEVLVDNAWRTHDGHDIPPAPHGATLFAALASTHDAAGTLQADADGGFLWRFIR